ncbi:hypothetical protein BDW22DRAFT_1433733 [Trametopsis cervina]|nr:hypothetical protein BDW22DRAFT_1433733 [Trametopsis cervina]
MKDKSKSSPRRRSTARSESNETDLPQSTTSNSAQTATMKWLPALTAIMEATYDDYCRAEVRQKANVVERTAKLISTRARELQIELPSNLNKRVRTWYGNRQRKDAKPNTDKKRGESVRSDEADKEQSVPVKAHDDKRQTVTENESRNDAETDDKADEPSMTGREDISGEELVTHASKATVVDTNDTQPGAVASRVDNVDATHAAQQPDTNQTKNGGGTALDEHDKAGQDNNGSGTTVSEITATGNTNRGDESAQPVTGTDNDDVGIHSDMQVDDTQITNRQDDDQREIKQTETTPAATDIQDPSRGTSIVIGENINYSNIPALKNAVHKFRNDLRRTFGTDIDVHVRYQTTDCATHTMQ